MRLAAALFSLALVADVAIGNSWFSNAAYNKWHETELERWLSDHDVPYPTPADRKQLEKLVSENWDTWVSTPYKNWDAAQLSEYLKQKGIETKDSAGATKDSLLSQVQSTWYESEDKAQGAWASVKDWILDTWTDSQLKSFCDYHGIPVPQPRQRDTLLQKARSAYQTAAEKAGETVAYPGNWLYETWTESDLKEWLDTHGVPAPQPTTVSPLPSSPSSPLELANNVHSVISSSRLFAGMHVSHTYVPRSRRPAPSRLPKPRTHLSPTSSSTLGASLSSRSFVTRTVSMVSDLL